MQVEINNKHGEFCLDISEDHSNVFAKGKYLLEVQVHSECDL